MRFCALALAFFFLPPAVHADEIIRVWPGLAPGESTENSGEILPFRASEIPPVTRVVRITHPTMTFHPAKVPNGSAAIILPGGGFGKVVPDKEGTEAADWLNRHGISAFVLSYRTTESGSLPGWVKASQDTQRAMAVVRSQSTRFHLEPARIGIVAFSAGGQVGARLLCDGGKLTYPPLDDIDRTSHRPDFAVLVYPWNLYDADRNSLADSMTVPADCPPTWIVHTDDDRSSSLGAVLFYAGLKRQGIPAALHVYGNGGHGYGLREVKDSQISTWPGHAMHWLQQQQFATR